MLRHNSTSELRHAHHREGQLVEQYGGHLRGHDYEHKRNQSSGDGRADQHLDPDLLRQVDPVRTHVGFWVPPDSYDARLEPETERTGNRK